MNRLRGERIASEAGMNAELAKIGRATDRLIKAICDRVPGVQVKGRITELEARQTEIETKIAKIDTPAPHMHPNMVGYYREQLWKLRDALNDPGNRSEAADICAR